MINCMYMGLGYLIKSQTGVLAENPPKAHTVCDMMDFITLHRIIQKRPTALRQYEAFCIILADSLRKLLCKSVSGKDLAEVLCNSLT